MRATLFACYGNEVFRLCRSLRKIKLIQSLRHFSSKKYTINITAASFPNANGLWRSRPSKNKESPAAS